MAILTGVYEIIPVTDGSQSFPTLDVSGALSQSYSGTTYFPDWKNNAALRPVVTPRCYDGLEGSVTQFGFVPGIVTSAGQAATANQQWYYNNTPVIWTQVGTSSKYRSNFLSADGTTPLMELDYSDQAHPWLTFIGNIPTDLSSGDDDKLRFVGKVDGLDGFTIDVVRPIRVSELVGGTGNKIDIILSKSSFDNDSATNDSISVNLAAVINGEYKVGVNAINATGYKVSLASSIGIDHNYYRSGSSVVPNGASLDLSPNEIGGMGVIVATLLDANNNEAAVASERIRDLGDPDIISFESYTVANASSTTKLEDRMNSIKSGEFLRIIAKVTNRTGETDKTLSGGYWFHEARVVDKEGNTVSTGVSITQDANYHKILVVGFDLANSKGGLRFVCRAKDYDRPNS